MNEVLPPWMPEYYTEPINNNKNYSEVLEIISKEMLVARDGMKAGEAIILREWQKWALSNILEIDSEGNLRYKQFLLMIPRKNGKTFIAALLILFHLLTGPKYAQIFSAGKDQKQAEIVYEMVKTFIETSKELSGILKLNKSTKTFTNTATQAFYRPLSADAGGVHGLNPYFVVADELHVWEGLGTSKRAREFWDGLVSGMGARASSQLLVISTAGGNVNNSLLGELYTTGKKVISGEIVDESFGFICWEASETDSPLERKTWLKANPNLAEGFINEKTIESSLAIAASTGMTMFLRYYLNIWANAEGESFINKFYWQEAIKEGYSIPANSKITVGFDGSKTADTTAIVIQEVETGFVEVWEFWEKDELDPEWAINREDVYSSLKKLSEKYDIQLMWVDASYWDLDVRKWDKLYDFNVEIVPPSAARMTPLAHQFTQDLVEGIVKHGDDKELNKYSFRALLKDDGSFTKASNKMIDRIDLLVAAILANGARNFIEGREPKKVQKVIRLR